MKMDFSEIEQRVCAHLLATPPPRKRTLEEKEAMWAMMYGASDATIKMLHRRNQNV